MLKNAYYFGTFNPVHRGHLAIAQAALKQFAFDSIIFVPAGRSPFKQNDPDMAGVTDRLTMLTLAILQEPAFQIGLMEIEREGTSYTVDSVLQIKEQITFPVTDTGSVTRTQNPEPVPFIIGSDALASLNQWYRAEELVKHCHFIQAPRSNTPFVESIELEGKTIPLTTTVLQMPVVDVSSTEVRQLAGQQMGSDNMEQLASYLGVDPVTQYIASHQLYQALPVKS